jgi:putative NIF3 family GTP cyclohydrolase 1 type 2
MGIYTVGDIERLLFEEYPAVYAVEDDRFGLFVGDRDAEVSGVAFALDSTVPMIEAAVAAGCNMLVTHHPPFWMAPRSFFAERSAGSADGAAVFAAASKGVALLAMHTNVDCSPQAAELFMHALDCELLGVLKPHLSLSAGQQVGLGQKDGSRQQDDPAQQIGLGQLARPIQEPSNPAGINLAPSLSELAESCALIFGQPARIWGDPMRQIDLLAICSGGASEVIPEVIAAHPDCFITGELRHHECLYLADEGITLIELSHDRSELPYRRLMADSLEKHIKTDNLKTDNLPLVILEPTANWWARASYW